MQVITFSAKMYFVIGLIELGWEKLLNSSSLPSKTEHPTFLYFTRMNLLCFGTKALIQQL